MAYMGTYRSATADAPNDTVDLDAMVKKQQAQKTANEAPVQDYIAKVQAENEAARADTLAERQQVLDRITGMFGQVDTDSQTVMATARAAEQAQNLQMSRTFTEQLAQIGMAANPSIMLQLSRKMTASSMGRIAQTAIQVRQTALNSRMQLTNMLDTVYQATQRQTTSAGEEAQMISALGQAAGSSGGTVSVGSRTSSAAKQQSQAGALATSRAKTAAKQAADAAAWAKQKAAFDQTTADNAAVTGVPLTNEWLDRQAANA